MQPLKFQQCFVPVTKLSDKGFCEGQRFRHLRNHIFPSQQFQKYLSYENQLLFKILKFLSSLQMHNKNLRKKLKFSR